MQVLLGLAHDTLICALLTRLSLEHSINAIALPAFSMAAEAWNVPGTKCLKRIFASLRLCTPTLVGLINGQGSTKRSYVSDRSCRTATEALVVLLRNDSNALDRGNAEHIENALIAARTQVNCHV